MEKNNKRKFADADIIAKRRSLEKRKAMSIQDGMYAGDEWITFSECKLFDGSMGIFLPDNFIDMPEDIRAIKYSFENVPDIIKSSRTGESAFSFQMTEEKLETSRLEDSPERFCRILKKLQPMALILDKGIQNASVSIAWLDYKGQGIDQALFQRLFVVPVKGKLMLGMFHCPFCAADRWKPVLTEILKTVSAEG